MGRERRDYCNWMLLLTELLVYFSLSRCVKIEDVVECTPSITDPTCCNYMRTDTLINLDIAFDCNNPDNVTILAPPGTNRTSPFRLFHSSSCITRLPNNICDYPNIVSIRIAHTSLKSIPSLSCLKDLIALDLSANKVEALKNDTFLELKRLRYINLSNNRISHIQPNSFKEDLEGLMIVSLAENRLKTSEAWLLGTRHEFCFFDLSNNEIEKFTNEDNWQINLFENYGPGMVKYSYNRFTKWITDELKLYGIKDLVTLGKFMSWGFDFRNNPWRCDCKLHEFLKLASNFPDIVWRDYFAVTCQSPQHLKDMQIVDVPMASLVCNITEKCPAGCFCQDQPEMEQMLVDCSGQGLTRLPLDLPDGNLKLFFTNNSIKSMDARQYLKRTKFMDISRNGLNYIAPEAIGQLQRNVKVLNLSKNSLKYLSEVIQNIPFSRMSLDNNSFVCDCNSTWMFTWLRQQEDDVSGITCLDQNKNVVTAVKADDSSLGCREVNPFARVLSVLFGILALVFIVIIVLLFIFRYEALILIHTSVKRLQKRTDGETDHDMFVSLEVESDTDRVWAVETLLPELEQKNNLKLYFAPRDMDPGSVIVDETIKTLKRSHTALIILSDSYLENPAKVFEFSEAYNIMVRQRLGRLIIVKSSEVKANSRGYLNAFIRLKKYIDREDVKLIEKIVKEVEREKNTTSKNSIRSVSQVHRISP